MHLDFYGWILKYSFRFGGTLYRISEIFITSFHDHLVFPKHFSLPLSLINDMVIP
jgi:hypothetical protein